MKQHEHVEQEPTSVPSSSETNLEGVNSDGRGSFDQRNRNQRNRSNSFQQGQIYGGRGQQKPSHQAPHMNIPQGSYSMPMQSVPVYQNYDPQMYAYYQYTPEQQQYMAAYYSQVYPNMYAVHPYSVPSNMVSPGYEQTMPQQHVGAPSNVVPHGKPTVPQTIVQGAGSVPPYSVQQFVPASVHHKDVAPVNPAPVSVVGDAGAHTSSRPVPEVSTTFSKQDAPAVTESIPVSSTDSAPVSSAPAPQRKSLSIKRKAADGSLVAVDINSFRSASAAAAPAVTTTPAEVDRSVEVVAAAVEEKLVVQTDVPLESDGPSTVEFETPKPTFGAPPALQKKNPPHLQSIVESAVPSSSSKACTRVYNRQELLELKPSTFNEMVFYTSLAVTYTDSGVGGSGKNSGREFRGGNNSNNNSSNDFGGNNDRRRQGGGRNREGEDWQKERLSPKAPPQRPVIPFKKDDNDPLEALSQEVTEILNKITPQNFEKLSRQILELKLTNTTMLDMLVKLIFEKAVFESGFSGVYADLCLFLKESSQWNFFQVVKNADKEEYFWVRDLTFPEEYAGPFFARSDINEAVASGAAMKAMPGQQLDNREVLLMDGRMLVRVSKNMSDSWVATFVPFDEVSSDSRSSNVFPDEVSALKDAQTAVSFRACLAKNCEREFQEAVQDENKYDGVNEQLRVLYASRDTVDPAEFERKEAEIEEARVKIKKRMLGNIKFVGELYKRKMLNTETMHDCITKLIGTPGEWKKTHDDQDMQLLLHLLTTLGESLESKSRKSKNKTLSVQFDQYFERLQQLRSEGNLPSQIRFGIDDLIDLRRNNWQGRRATDGPKKLDEIREKRQAEEQRAASAAASANNKSGGNSGKYGGGGSGTAGGVKGKPGSNDVRNQGNKAGGAPAGPGAKGSGPTAGAYTSSGVGKGSRPEPRDNGKQPRPVSTQGAGNNRNGRPPSTPSPTPVSSAAASSGANASKTVVFDFKAEVPRRRARETLEEYLSGVAIGEVVLTLREEPPVFQGFLVQEVISKLLDVSDAGKRSKIIGLLADPELLLEFPRGRDAILQGLENSEPFKNLVDTLMDCKEAPERIAQAVVVLVRAGLVTEDWISGLLTRFHAYNIEQDYNSPEDIASVYDRFRSTLATELGK